MRSTLQPQPSLHPRPAAAAARIALCGALTVEIGGRAVEDALPGRKGRLLLAYLVLGRGRSIGRDELIDAVWPHEAPADPDAAFATLLTRTRTALGRDVVRGGAQLSLALEDPAWIDWEAAHAALADAEAALAAGAAASALELASDALATTRAPLLPGFSTPWLEDRRRDLVELHAALLDIGGRAALALGGPSLHVAVRFARELIEREPYRETAYALLMEVHGRRGDVAEALRVYDDLRRLLREELGLAPSPCVTRIAEALLGAEPVVPAAAGERRLPEALAGGALLGRAAELEQLATACAAARTGTGGVVLVTGAAGAGKSCLAAEAARRAHADGFEVLHGRTDDDHVTPYQPFVEAIRQALAGGPVLEPRQAALLEPELAELARLVPDLRATVAPAADGADPDLRRLRLFDAVAALLGALLERRPVLLVLEDLQRADRSTLLLARHVLRAAQGQRLLVVATVCDGEPADELLGAVVLELQRRRALERVVL